MMRIRRHVRCSPRWMRLGSMQSPMDRRSKGPSRAWGGHPRCGTAGPYQCPGSGHPDVPTLTRDLRLVRADQERAQRLQEQALHISEKARVPTTPGPPRPTGPAAGNRALLSRQQRAAIAGAATVIIVAAVIGTGLFLQTPLTPSLVVLDATPWATITQIQNRDGEPQPLPEMRSTPLAVQLTPGAYTVSFEGPPPQSEKRTIEIRVESGAARTAPVQRFAAPSVDEYFRPYLTAPAPVSEPGAPLEEGLQ